MSNWVVGDIQGCLPELKELIEKINFDPTKDTLWSVGDLVNRGSDSLGVLKFCMQLGKSFKFVLGNHDIFLLNQLMKLKAATSQKQAQIFEEIDNSTKSSLQQFKPYLKKLFYDKQLDEIIHWLSNAELTEKITVKESRNRTFFLAHAGIHPSWSSGNLREKQYNIKDYISNCCAKNKTLDHLFNPSTATALQLREDCDSLVRMRKLNAHDLSLNFESVNTCHSTNEVPWFSVENTLLSENENYEIVFGHWAALGCKTDQTRIHAIDSACCWGGELTAFRLEDEMRVKVQAK